MGRVVSFVLLGSAINALCATSLPLAASEHDPHALMYAENDGQRHRAAVGKHQTHRTARRILHVHNSERGRLNLPHLQWNAHLEREAQEWANHLARRGVLQHADYRRRGGTGENLWMGTAGGWQVEGMVDMFIAEKRHYRHSRFPHVSRTGNWADVGHYTQVVWRDTREVGCAMATGRGNDVLVCRYYPAGNLMGSRAY